MHTYLFYTGQEKLTNENWSKAKESKGRIADDRGGEDKVVTRKSH